jgi:hypothetical protein
MKFTVSGADRTSGQDVTQTFDAASAAEAESIASLSMLVSQVTPQAVQPMEVQYATPTIEVKAAGVDWNSGIVLYAKFLRIGSLVLAVMAVIPALEYFWDLGVTAWYLTYSVTARLIIDLLDQIATSGRLFLVVELLAAALCMRLASYIALAIREMAINRPKG